jgi:hypothetical protein
MNTWNRETLTTVTLSEGTWQTVRCALLCISADESNKGNHADAAHWYKAYQTLKEAMGMDT